jgi:hypothetical protein
LKQSHDIGSFFHFHISDFLVVKKSKKIIMETTSWTVNEIDPNTKVTKDMYDPNYMNIKSLPVCTLFIGQSNSGKTTILVNLLIHKLLWEYDADNIFFFSKTIMGDKTYRPVLRYLADNDMTMNISKHVDFDIIDKIVKEQELIKLKNMAAINPGESDFDTDAETDFVVPPKYLFIFDDIISDRQFKSYNSKLSDFSTYSRHYEIAIIINS